jgi:hypothetical protein
MGAEAIASANPYAAAAQMGLGVIQAGNQRLKKLRGMRTAYQTPQEYYDMNAMALNAAQTGFGAQTMSYLTNQTDRALSSSLGTAVRLGADANNIADIYDKNVQSIFKIGSDNELQQYAKFNKVYETTQTLANQKVAEWADKEAKIKDDMAAAAQKVAAGNANQQSGLNMLIGGAANGKASGLWSTKTQQPQFQQVETIPTVLSPSQVYSNAPQSINTNQLMPMNSLNKNIGFDGGVPYWFKYAQ